MIIRILLLFSLLVINLWWGPQLPDQLPIHWNLQGSIDAYAPKIQSLWFAPLMIVFMCGLFEIIPFLDRDNQNRYESFKPEWNIVKTGLVGFFVYVHIIMLYSALNPQFSFVRLFVVWFWVIVYCHR